MSGVARRGTSSILPVGDTVAVGADERGSAIAHARPGTGQRRAPAAYLQLANVTRNVGGDGWLVNGAALDVGRSYSVAINDFLLTGREIKARLPDPTQPRRVGRRKASRPPPGDDRRAASSGQEIGSGAMGAA